MSIAPSDKSLIDRLLTLTRELSGLAVGDAVGVTGTTVGRWRKGKYPVRGLHQSTRARIEAILAQPGWKYVASTEPTADEEVAAERRAAYAAGVLWSIAQDAEHLARKAREAHARITGKGTPRKVRSAAVVAETAAQAIAEKKRLGVSARHGRRHGPPKQA